MRLIAGAALVALAACSGAAEPEEPEEAQTSVDASAPATSEELPAQAAAPPVSAGEALLTSLTWSGLDGEGPSGPFAPRDDCGDAEGAYEFRIALADAVIARDADALVALSSPNIKLDFGGGEGREELRRRLSEPGWLLWEELAEVLPLGCAVGSGGWLTIPWHFAQDIGQHDPYALEIVLGDHVPLRRQASMDGEVLRFLSWEGVERLSYYRELSQEDFDPEIFELVTTADGTEGFVERARLRSLIDFRMIIERGDSGEWELRSFLAGD